MPSKLSLFAIVSSLLISTFMNPAEARDTRHMINYSDAMNTPNAKAKLGNDVKFFFGSKSAPAIEREFGEFDTNKKTNAFNKTDIEACNWVFLSAILSLKKRAQDLGADAVVNIKSNYKKNLLDNDTQFECGAGGLMAGVALKGTMVKLKK